MERYICVHGHFYQPPRENPWLEAIELQPSARPYHDWNERITAECYATNARSRILDETEQIVQMMNNYARISFNFGPTLLSWLEQNAPKVYSAIIEADQESQTRFSGHGSALAQGYNHVILPLANRRDRWTQILWGIRDFRHRFGRDPEGMWLPETAVDIETLDILSENGIRFSILAPHQARRVRAVGTGEWRDVGEAKIDPTRAYTMNLPSGRSIAIFFYDGPTSRAVAFERLLKNGESFAKRLLGVFSKNRSWPQIVHIATDGETYGHHHRFGEMALAYALRYIESNNLAYLTNYGEYLEKHPPTQEVEILENTSWSCAHGIERWRSDCGCDSGTNPTWNQAWRTPLRNALDWLRDKLAPACEERARSLLKDLWETRDDYIQVILDRGHGTTDAFLKKHAIRELTEPERIRVLKILEIQRHAMLMYTSCGWFYDELSGIETVQVIQYAGRAIQLAHEVLGENLEPGFFQILRGAKSNIREHQDGQRIYEKFVKTAVVDLEKVCAHYAVSSLFEAYEEQTSVNCYTINQESYQSAEAGKAKIAVGRVRMTSEITGESSHFCFGALHLGDHNLNCGVRPYQGEEAYGTLVQEISEAFSRADFPETILLLDKHFGASTYSLMSLFRDERQKILDRILATTLQEVETIYRQIYDNHVPLIRFFKNLGIPAPRPLYLAAELVLNASLRRAFEQEELYPDLINTFWQEAEVEGISLDTETLEYTLRKSLERMAHRLLVDPAGLGLLQRLETGMALLDSLPVQVNLWTVQNICYDLLESVYPEVQEKAEGGDDNAGAWAHSFKGLCGRLSISIK
jgi:alpha-amylase/alpha-mannosidase (GH57 family)